ncbi:hypothetical protein IWQ61_005815 [Dispira simplex]|nr:hypothetical protein IWQ61_005815 [Dispira simplex]
MADQTALTGNTPVLYTYYRSSCSARVRIALNWKGIPYEMRFIHLVKAEQRDPTYLKVNPSGFVPTLCIDGHTLQQSVAILEYLEETHTERPLLPTDAAARAKVRTLVNIVACDIQPVQNLKVLQQFDTDQRPGWSRWTITAGFQAMEALLRETAGMYCVGDKVTLADVCLFPQVWNAQRFGVDMSQFPLIGAIYDQLMTLEPFKAAFWKNQPDCPDELRSG